MPTASEYQQPQPQPSPVISNPVCDQLQALFNASPQLKSAFGCDISPTPGEVFDQCDTVYKDVLGQIGTYLQSCLSACQEIGSDCNACIQSKILLLQDRIDAVATKCGSRVSDLLRQKVTEVAAAMSVIGIQPPTDTQLAAVGNGDAIPPPPPAPVPPTPCAIDDLACGIVNGNPPPIPTVPGNNPPDLPPPNCPPGSFALGDGTCTPPPPPQTCPPGYTLVNGQCLNQFGFPPPPPGILPTTPPPPVIQPQPPGPQPPQPPLPPFDPNEQLWGVVCAGTSVGWQAIFGFLSDFQGRTDLIAGPFRIGSGPLATDPANSAIWTAASNAMGCGTTTPPPPPPPPSNCPQCQAGYEWSTDSNGNPVCKPSCNCPVCPPPPPPPNTLPGGQGDLPSPEPPPTSNALCGPKDANIIEAFVSVISGTVIPQGNEPCGYGLTDWIKDTIVGGINPFGGGNKPGFVTSAFNSFKCLAGWAVQNLFKPFFPTGNCNLPALLGHSYTAFIPRLIDRILGVTPRIITGVLQQRENYICQWVTPGQGELNAAYIRNWFKEDEWKFGTKLNANCIDWQKCLVEAGRTRIGIRDAYRLQVLGQLTDDDFERAWRENGIDYDRDLDTWVQTMYVYPGPTDLIRFMVRDVGDEKVVQKYELSEGFEEKWTGDVQKWGNAQGINDEIALKHWQAHWQSAAPTNIYDWLHRFREDDRSANDPNRNLTFTSDDAEDALKIADYVPGLIKFYMGASYKLISRVDIRRFYRTDVFKGKDEVRQAYRDLGYDSVKAQQQADFVEISEREAKAKIQGFMPASEVVKLYENSLLSSDDATRMMLDAGIPADNIGQRLESADIRRNSKQIQTVRKALRTRYFMGEFTESELQSQLSIFGTPQERVSEIAATWQQEKLAKSKHVAVGKLCDMFGKGQIQMDEYMRRVRNLGYPEADALLLIENCVIGIKERQAKALEKEYERQARAKKEQDREARRIARELAPCRVVKPVCGATNGKAK